LPWKGGVKMKFKRVIKIGLAMLVIVGILSVTAPFAASHGGGGGGGGFHGGGFGGGYHGGGFGGGYHGGGYHGYDHHGLHNPWGYYWGWGYPYYRDYHCDLHDGTLYCD